MSGAATLTESTMRYLTRFLASLLLVAAFAQGRPLGAQAPRPAVTPMTPSAAHERLAFFEGDWTVEEVPASREFRERCAWLEGGRRHMVCRTRSKSASGEWRDGLSMFSVRPADSSYVYYGMRPSGATQLLHGRSVGDGQGWEFRGDEGVGPARTRTLVNISRLPGGRFLLVEQTAPGDTPFGKADTVHYRAARPGPGAP